MKYTVLFLFTVLNTVNKLFQDNGTLDDIIKFRSNSFLVSKMIYAYRILIYLNFSYYFYHLPLNSLKIYYIIFVNCLL